MLHPFTRIARKQIFNRANHAERGGSGILVFVVSCLVCAVSAFAGDVTLAWDPSSGFSVAGYIVYYGTSSRSYGSPIDAGKKTTYTLTGLSAGTYFFAVTAYDILGNESEFSNEVSASISQSSSCDISGDSAVNVLDLQLLANIILGKVSAAGNGDLNQDSRIDVLDLQVLANVNLGMRSCP